MFITQAFAQAAGGASGGSDLFSTLFGTGILPIIMIFVIMYFLILRPQQNKQRQHKEMVANVRRGDTVVTSGGLIGKVAKVEDNELQVELAEGVRVRVVRGMVAEVRAKGEPVKEST
jgi:preprotein translocase subunit YajC